MLRKLFGRLEKVRKIYYYVALIAIGISFLFSFDLPNIQDLLDLILAVCAIQIAFCFTATSIMNYKKPKKEFYHICNYCGKRIAEGRIIRIQLGRGFSSKSNGVPVDFLAVDKNLLFHPGCFRKASDATWNRILLFGYL